MIGIVGNVSFLEDLRLLLNTTPGLDIRRVYTTGVDTGDRRIGRIVFGGNRKVSRFMKWLYQDAELCLKRKRDKYQNMVSDKGVFLNV